RRRARAREDPHQGRVAGPPPNLPPCCRDQSRGARVSATPDLLRTRSRRRLARCRDGDRMKTGCAVLLAVAGVLFARAAEASRSCQEVSDIVGEEVCRRYGSDWSVESRFPFIFRFGLRYTQLSTSGLQFKESFKKGTRPPGYEGYAYGGEA